MSEKVKTVASLQSQVSRLEDSSQEVNKQLSNLSVRLREEQQKVQVAQEETQTLRSKISPPSLSFVHFSDGKISLIYACLYFSDERHVVQNTSVYVRDCLQFICY